MTQAMSRSLAPLDHSAKGKGAANGMVPVPIALIPNASRQPGARATSSKIHRVALPGPDQSRGQLSRPEAVSRAAAGAAHDLVNLLFVMNCNLDLLSAEVLSPGATVAVGALRAQTSYLRGLARQLRVAASDSGLPSVDRRTLIAVWWSDMAALIRAAHGNDIDVEADIPAQLPSVRIDPDQLTQVVLNLVGNAVHAIGEHAREDAAGGWAHRRQPGKVTISAGLAARGHAVTLAIADNGGGMSPSVLARACEPLFTTRADQGGSGLGLSMVQRRMAEVGGRLHLDSAVGVGTTITLELPT
jgi:signal transduction histidine kinase